MTKHLLAPYALLILQKQDHILLLKRSDNASFAPGFYCLPGGSVEKNETFRQAIIREAAEELGIIIDPKNLHFEHIFYRQGTENELAACIFSCSIWGGEICNKEENKHSELLWVDLHDVPNKTIPAHKGALVLIAEGETYSEQAGGNV